MSVAPRIPETHRLILVRHAQSSTDASRHPREWDLTEDGRAAARRLTGLGLFDHATGFYAGPEPKMLDTLAPVATSRAQRIEPEPGFGETQSEGWFEEAEFLATVRRFFEAPHEPPAPGWETAHAAATRFGASADAIRPHHAPIVRPGHVLPGTFAIASGGRALTIYLATLFGYTPSRAFDAWRSLRLPDLAVLELSATAATRLVIPFGTLSI